MGEQKTIVKFYVRLGKSIEEVTNDLVKVYEEKTMAPRTIRKWVKRFKEDWQSTEDDLREGRPSTSTTQNQIKEVQRMVNDDPKITIWTIRGNLTSVWNLWFQLSTKIWLCPRSMRDGYRNYWLRWIAKQESSSAIISSTYSTAIQNNSSLEW